LPPDDDSNGIRIHGHVLLPSRIGVKFHGYFTIAKAHPLLSASTNFLLSLLGPKLYQFTTLEIEEVDKGDDDEEHKAAADKIDVMVDEQGKKDRNVIMTALNPFGSVMKDLFPARSFKATIGPLKLRDHQSHRHRP
jgi:hypothetical protein